jgi:transposase-like protein
MKRDDRFDLIDKAALHWALLAERVCPRCRSQLGEVGTTSKRFTLWACDECGTTWQEPIAKAD